MTDNTASQRQQRRLERLASQGLYRRSILVHADCHTVFEQLKPYFADPKNLEDLKKLSDILIQTKPVNVSKVRQLSPFRYPGGKTWLVPEIRKWINELEYFPSLFIEPFAGGGIASLTVAVEDLVERVMMVEIDPDVAAVWNTILKDPNYLCDRILSFDVTRENVLKIINKTPLSEKERAFRTIIKNRTQRGGILAPGASLVKTGENGKGLKSRWYPETLVKRIKIIHNHREKIDFIQADGLDIIKQYMYQEKAVFFIDPPYTAGGKNAGKRLYAYSKINHKNLFEYMSNVLGEFIITYDDSDEVLQLARKHNFYVSKVPMKNTHHEIKYELLVKKCN